MATLGKPTASPRTLPCQQNTPVNFKHTSTLQALPTRMVQARPSSPSLYLPIHLLAYFAPCSCTLPFTRPFLYLAFCTPAHLYVCTLANLTSHRFHFTPNYLSPATYHRTAFPPPQVLCNCSLPAPSSPRLLSPPLARVWASAHCAPAPLDAATLQLLPQPAMGP